MQEKYLIMKQNLTKENVYVSLKGKSKEELTDLYEFLTSNGEKVYRNKEGFLEYNISRYKSLNFEFFNWIGYEDDVIGYKTEVTIKELKQIIKPSMETKFKPIAMRCTQEQFEAIRPKLEKIGKIDEMISAFKRYNYLTNNYDCEKLNFDCVDKRKDWEDMYKGNIHEEWNEEIFLQHCGIETEESTKQKIERLEKELAELKSTYKVEVNLYELPTELQEKLKEYLK